MYTFVYVCHRGLHSPTPEILYICPAFRDLIGMYFTAIHLMGVYFISVQLVTGYLTSIYFTAMHLMSLYFTGMHLLQT